MMCCEKVMTTSDSESLLLEVYSYLIRANRAWRLSDEER